MINILFVGNSFTFYNDLPGMLTEMAAAAGIEMSASRVLVGGAYLNQYADPDHERGKMLLETYPTKKWDYIVLQDQSFNPANKPEDFFASVEKLCAYMDCGAKFLFYSTWAYENNTELLCSTGMTYTEMLTALTSAYRKAAEIHSGIRVPVGEAFALTGENCADINVYHPDSKHPSPCGTYLAACLFCKAIFGELPEESVIPEGVAAEQCDALRRIAAQF
ncbi:MAG: DUF4886 domain-containing protein [Clostridia bacterium]|nr:DUF4886 domain-containing protein [Clostridia bacterium]